MYVFYQHHRDGHGKVVLTEIKMSSSKDRWKLNFNNSVDELQFNLTKQVLKTPPVGARMYDDSTKVWTYLEDHGVQVIEKIKTATSVVGGGATLVEVDNLAEIAAQYFFDVRIKAKAQRPEDFFYEHGQLQATPAITKTVAAAKLLTLFETPILPTDPSDLKKLYRRAALRLHPDRNGGDGSRMSDLNMYWGIYNA